MKMRKLFAGLAAAATLLSGLALGATTASAAEVSFENNKTITVTATDAQQFYTQTVDTTNLQSNLRTFDYVKLAGYEKVAGTGVKLVNGLTGDAANAAFAAAGYDATKNGSDPWQWLGTTSGSWTADQTKGFVNALKDSATTGVTPVASNEGKTLTFTFDSAGLYLIVDKSGDLTITDTVDSKLVWKANGPFLAGTKIENADPAIQNALGALSEGTIDAKSGSVETHKGGFTFKKVDANNAKVSGAVFVVKNSEGKYGQYSNNNWTWTDTKPGKDNIPADDAQRKAAGLFVSGDNLGTVQVQGLTAGTYTVEEIKAAEGYLQTALPSFTVTINDQGQVTSYDVNTLDTWSLVDGDVNSGVTVKNVKSITQLPLTGAAGTILFSAVGVILAAAAGTVFLKSRSTKRALRA
ncbi:SpaA isopeptide-forming pilin-related protein [Bifidobacterium vansinderenii]|uniref:Cell surface protein n=1 Tax=Bifidobacterium vansinderenii TaxID=1984871 RepID=A0A229VYF1_9BIFI|nr:SpaA isopeptide-forming pilin-related protein [Bifidobacterium vansinderenii]OXN00627.1 cell surface protein [Bifidobacterium vansinderenii]